MTEPTPKHRGAWSRALYLADLTPASRNRYVDLLRFVAITCVVLGHWTIAAPYMDEHAQIAHLLEVAPWSQWITWFFQVMPVFFFVGGFSNATSWDSVIRKEGSFAEWFSSRLQRLLGPVLILLAFWAVGALIALKAGVHPEMVRTGSQIALIPTWFLAVYIVVCMVVPFTYGAWKRWGIASFWACVVAAIAMDIMFFAEPRLRPVTWLNYLFIWLGVHQLGYAWRDGLKGGLKSLAWGSLSLATLFALIFLGPYPLSLVGVPGQMTADGLNILSNTSPPKLPLLALGLTQIGTLLSLQGPANRMLAKRTPWAATVLANGMIMTVFLWHSTAMMLLFGVGFLLDGFGLHATPGTSTWWMIRPLWILVFAVGTFPFVMIFQRFERTSGRPALPVPFLVVGCFLACGGLAKLAMNGVNVVPEGAGYGTPSPIYWVPLALVFVGCGVAGFGPLGALVAKVRGQ